MALFGSRNETIVLYFSPHSLTLSVITSVSKIAISRLIAFQTYNFDAFEYHDGMITNPAHLQAKIRAFLKKNNIQSQSAIIVLGQSCIKEEVIALPKAFAQKNDFHFPDRNICIWQYQYLYAHEQLGHLFYVSALYPWRFYQYQRLMQDIGLQLQGIVSATSAHLAAYKLWYGDVYRSSQLAHDFQKSSSIAEFFTNERLCRLIEFSPSFRVDRRAHQAELAAMVGVCQKGI